MVVVLAEESWRRLCLVLKCWVEQLLSLGTSEE